LISFVSSWDARDFWLQQFVFAGVVLNPKIWWSVAFAALAPR
jgi:hypothetical protein